MRPASIFSNIQLSNSRDYGKSLVIDDKESYDRFLKNAKKKTGYLQKPVAFHLEI